jgi:hypothetical protein
MVRKYYKLFDAIECSIDPILYPCCGDPLSAYCLKYGSLFCNNCGHKEASHRAEFTHQQFKLYDEDRKRTSANSATSFKNLSPGKKDSRMSSLAKDRRTFILCHGRHINWCEAILSVQLVHFFGCCVCSSLSKLLESTLYHVLLSKACSFDSGLTVDIVHHSRNNFCLIECV